MVCFGLLSPIVPEVIYSYTSPPSPFLSLHHLPTSLLPSLPSFPPFFLLGLVEICLNMVLLRTSPQICPMNNMIH